MQNCPRRLINIDGWKIEVIGFIADNLSNGFERETDIKDIDISIPIAVI